MAWRDYIPRIPALQRRASTIDLLNANQQGTTPSPGMPGGRPHREEYGVTGTANFGGVIKSDDFNPDLDDWERACKIYEKMRRTDAQIRSMLHVIKLPLRGAQWEAIPPTGGDPVDQEIADFVNASLFDDDAMDTSWDYVLRHILLQLDHGVSVLELVYRVDDDGFYRLKKLAPRLSRTIKEWHVQRDGKLLAVVQYAPVSTVNERFHLETAGASSKPPTYITSVNYQYLTIPAEYLAVFSLDREGDGYTGTSVLRTVYRNWWFKDQAYHLEGVALDRYAVGVPTAELDINHNLTPKDIEALVTTLKGMRSHERAYLVAPAGVRFRILPEGGSAGSTDIMPWIEHHDSQMARNVLAGFLTMGRDTHGTLGFGSRLTDMFISSLSGVAKGIAADLKSSVVKPLCDLNFDMTRRQYPSIVARDLENIDLQNLVQTFAALQGTVLTPTDDDETMFRKVMGAPPLPHEFSRKKAMEDQKSAAEAAQVNQALNPAAVPPGQPGGEPATEPAKEQLPATELPGQVLGE